MNMHYAFLFFFKLIFSLPFALGAEDVQVPTVIIEDNPGSLEKPIDEFSVFKSEKVDTKKIKSSDRQNLSDILKDQAGVDSQIYCANCGAKRLTINGLKGEHTSILIDGLPLHSAISSFYGVDNIPSLGLEEIQVMRGAGASLTNPEAIGGTLNLVTVNPLDFKNSYATSFGFDDKLFGKSENHSFLLGKSSTRAGYVFGGQFSTAETWDVDNNNVAESPQRVSGSAVAKARWLPHASSDFSLRVGHSQTEILGGYYRPTKPNGVRPLAAQESDFKDGNVENDFIGDPAKITDWVDIKRTEAAMNVSVFHSNRLTQEVKLGYARQAQQAIYQHGFDYANVDRMFVGDTNFKMQSGENSLVTLGLFAKDQRLRSASESLFEKYPSTDSRDIKKDSFDFKSYATYAKYSTVFAEKLEVDFALRFDYIDINWLELENEIKQPILAPRVQLLNNITEHLQQRLSYGLGYRAPLTFFESQHGNNESGYEVDIDKLEKAHSVVLSTSYNTPDYYLTLGGHYTHLQNMAYGFEEFNQPVRYRNSETSYDIWVTDLLAGYKPWSWWFLETGIELYQYEDEYKRRLPTAAIEKRIQLKSTIEKRKWSHSAFVNIIGSRDLSKYGSYNEHFVKRNQSSEPNLDPTLGKKNQNSPTYFTLDTSLSYEFKRAVKITFTVNNVFNYTQTGEGDSPAAWHWHFNHAHYDGLHTWGPNTGRQYYLSLSGEI